MILIRILLFIAFIGVVIYAVTSEYRVKYEIDKFLSRFEKFKREKKDNEK